MKLGFREGGIGPVRTMKRMGRFRTACSVMLDVAANQALRLGSERIRSASLRAHEERPVLAKTAEIAASWIFVPNQMLCLLARMLRALAWKTAVRLGIRDRTYGAREFEAADSTRLSVRPFRKRDAADCSDMIRAAYLRRLLRREEEKRLAFLSKTSETKIVCDARKYDWFVAECDGKVVGALGAIRWGYDSATLTDFCVDEAFQRRGIGTILGAAYVAQKRREGVEFLSAFCLERSRRILIRHGFSYRGEDGEYYGEPLHRLCAFLDYEVMWHVRGVLFQSGVHS